jgi:hypothetical protein
LNYVIRHKWYVFLECRKLGIGWLGLVHDWSKFRPSEFIPYARHFYGKRPDKNCYECTHIAGSQCDVNYSGIGQGEQASNCEDYTCKPGISKGRDKSGYYKPYDTGDPDFDFAWLLHQKRNRHHWQYWILPNDEQGTKMLRVPKKYVREMLADWRGASKAQGHGGDIRKWWFENNQKIQIHPEAYTWLDMAARQRIGDSR